MAVLVTAEIPGAQEADAERWAELTHRLRAQAGFEFHADGPTEDGWRVIEVWDSEEAFDRWYDEAIKPNLPPGAPDRKTVQRLARVVRA